MPTLFTTPEVSAWRVPQFLFGFRDKVRQQGLRWKILDQSEHRATIRPVRSTRRLWKARRGAVEAASVLRHAQGLRTAHRRTTGRSNQRLGYAWESGSERRTRPRASHSGDGRCDCRAYPESSGLVVVRRKKRDCGAAWVAHVV